MLLAPTASSLCRVWSSLSFPADSRELQAFLADGKEVSVLLLFENQNRMAVRSWKNFSKFIFFTCGDASWKIPSLDGYLRKTELFAALHLHC